MRTRLFSRHRTTFRTAALAVVLSAALFQLRAQNSAPPGAPEVLDRVVAVVNNHAILASDIEEEMRLSVLDPGQGGLGELTPQRALEQLIARALIQQQMRQEDTDAAQPTEAELDARLKEIRTELPACVRQNCASDDRWRAFLKAHGLTQARVEAYLRFRVEILRFIEQRFRQGIRIPQQDIDAYYRNTVLPQYKKGEEIPPLDKVSSRIEEILLQQRVNALFDDWLSSLRRQGDVEVLDPALEQPASAPPASGATQQPQASPAVSRMSNGKASP